MNSPNNNIYFSLFKKKFIGYSYLWIMIFGLCFEGNAQEIDPNGKNVFYYENGRKASEGYFKDGLPVGIWKSYYEDGTIKSIGQKKLGLSDSLWIFYDEEGRKRKTFQYENDKKNGCAVFLDTLGNVVKEMFYINDVPQGERVEYFPDGNIKSFVEIIDGKEEGLLLEYNEDGIVITEALYDNGFLKDQQKYNRYDEEGKKTGVWRTYFKNGDIASEIVYKAGSKNGLSKIYNKKGKLIDLQKMQGDTVAGHRDELVIIDLYKTFYPNGNLKLIGGINQGKKNGIFREYSEDGEIINGYIYANDTLEAEGIITGYGIYEGDWVYYFKSGAIKAKGAYENSKKTGKWIYFFSDGKKEQEGSFKEDKLSGSWIWYYHNGQVRREEYYNRNENLEGTVYEYDSLGTALTEGDYFDGVREGPWFYHVNDFKEVGSFVLGYKDGLWHSYYKNGKIAFKGEYNDGEPIGKHYYYHQNGITKKVGKYLGGEMHGKWRTYDRMGIITQEIIYKRGEIYKIDGVKVIPVTEEL